MKTSAAFLLVLLLSAGAVYAELYSEEPISDTWVWEGFGPYGGSISLRTNTPSVGQRIVMMFDLSAITPGTVVNSAYLHVYRYDGNPGSALECDIFRVTEYWEESTVVDTVAHYDGFSYDQIVVGASDWYTFDITQLAQEWIDGTYDNYGIMFYGTGGTGSYQYFRSREATTNKPYLEIDYTPVALEVVTFGSIKALFR